MTDPDNWAIQYKTLLTKLICPPMKAPNVTAGFTCPPEILAPTDTATTHVLKPLVRAPPVCSSHRPLTYLSIKIKMWHIFFSPMVNKIWNSEKWIWLSIILKAMSEPYPAKTKMSVEMNSASAAIRASGLAASLWWPSAMLVMAISI